jgi:hypothetical protein
VGPVLRAAAIRQQPMMDESSTLAVPVDRPPVRVSTVAQLAAIPEERNLAAEAKERAHPPHLPPLCRPWAETQHEHPARLTIRLERDRGFVLSRWREMDSNPRPP